MPTIPLPVIQKLKDWVMQEADYAGKPAISSRTAGNAARARCAIGQRHDAAGSGHWSDFWHDFGEGDTRPLRCHIIGDGEQVVDRHWSHFANRLEKAAWVLDIGCGAGTVGRTLLRSRADLRISGVDFAEVPQGNTPGLTIHPWVRMEALPFEDASFDGAVSLFGIEYGDIAPTAVELGRVIKPGGCFSLVVHHHGSETAAEGRARVKGIGDVLSGKVRAAFLSGDTDRFDRQRLRLLSLHPGEPTVRLLCDYFRRTITRTRAERHATWQKIVEDVAVEVRLTSEMVRSAKSPAKLGTWLAPLLSTMTALEVSVLRRRSGQPIGWLVGGTR